MGVILEMGGEPGTAGVVSTTDTADEGTAVTRPPPAAHRKVGESERAPSVPALPPSVDDAIESVTLTEDDYNDPELLSQLQDIGFVERASSTWF